MSGEDGSSTADGKPDDWDEKEEKDDSIRESVFEGDDSSEYIQGAILEASKSEREKAISASESQSRFQIWLAENVTEHDDTVERILQNANPRNYDRLDWIFAFSFVVLLAGMAVMFQTSSKIVAVGSLVLMVFAFVSMLLCVGVEDILKEGFHSVGGGDEDER
jgi:hypothetical protein